MIQVRRGVGCDWGWQKNVHLAPWCRASTPAGHVTDCHGVRSRQIPWWQRYVSNPCWWRSRRAEVTSNDLFASFHSTRRTWSRWLGAWGSSHCSWLWHEQL